MMYYPYLQNYQNNFQSQMNQQSVPQSGITWVQGEAGAKSYMVGAGNSVLLMDSESSSFYIKSTDASGMPLPLRIFDYTERTVKQNAPASAVAEFNPEKYVTKEEFEEKIKSLMAKKEVEE